MNPLVDAGESKDLSPGEKRSMFSGRKRAVFVLLFVFLVTAVTVKLDFLAAASKKVEPSAAVVTVALEGPDIRASGEFFSCSSTVQKETRRPREGHGASHGGKLPIGNVLEGWR